MGIRQEVIPFAAFALILGVVIVAGCRLKGLAGPISIVPGALIAAILLGYFLYFFRDPERTAPTDPQVIVAAADGTLALITEVHEDKYLQADTVRVSIFLSLFSVHVNRAPISGSSTFLGYFPGKRYFTFEEKSSDYNQHNAILIKGERTRCLVKQIVGPVCRRVVYWPDHDNATDLKKGDRIGMMKFGSRLDMYFPKDEVVITAQVGDKVSAGETVIGHLKGGTQ
jgi:phosphatidylserine decarboxylase